MKTSKHNSPNDNDDRGVDFKKRAIVLGVAAVAALPFGASSAANGIKELTGSPSPAADTSPESSKIDSAHRYPAPPKPGVIRVEHKAVSGDSASEIAESIAITHNRENVGDHLDAMEVKDSMYSAGGKTPEGYSIPPSLEDGLNVGEHIVVDIKPEDALDK